MNVSNRQPSLKETIDSVTDVQRHRYNTATLDLLKVVQARLSEELSTPDRPITSHFVEKRGSIQK
jgi:hypothetical protein